MNHFRDGFLHDVSQRARPFPSSSAPRTVPVELGRRRSESRPSVSTVRDFYTSRPTRGDSTRFLRIREVEESSVRDGRFDASLFSLLAKIGNYTRTRSKKNYLYNYDVAACCSARCKTSNGLFYIFFKNNSCIF